jgi:hypothetical protein
MNEKCSAKELREQLTRARNEMAAADDAGRPSEEVLELRCRAHRIWTAYEIASRSAYALIAGKPLPSRPLAPSSFHELFYECLDHVDTQ